MRFLSEASVFHFSAVVCGTRSKDLQCAVYITACGIRLRLSTIERLGWRFRGITIQYVRLSFLPPPPPAGGKLPSYMDYTDMCSSKGYVFLAVLAINRVSILTLLVINRVWILHSSLELGMFFKRDHLTFSIGLN